MQGEFEHFTNLFHKEVQRLEIWRGLDTGNHVRWEPLYDDPFVDM